MQGEYRGDFTRDTFDPAKHFSRVLMQQGRALLDADWNEQTSILLHYLRTLATDLIGPHWGPKKIEGEDNTGFLIEKRMQSGAEIKNDFSIQPGRYYVDGFLCENDVAVAYTEQDGFPLKEADKLKQNFSLVYLDVWERHITALEDSLIREVALGGPDTATRAQVVRQIKVDNVNERSASIIAEIKQAADGLLAAMNGTVENKKTKAEEYLKVLVSEALQRANTGKLRARAQKTDKPDEPCAVSPESRYRGAENHLYRIEIHKSGEAWDKQLDNTGKPAGNIAKAATFKWSRDNGSIIFPIRSLGGGEVTLAHLGRDISSSLQVNDWVEIVDDDLVLRGEPGPLRQVESIDPVEMSVTLKEALGTLPAYDESSTNHPLLRRWDHQRDSLRDGALTLKEGTGEDEKEWIALEDGIQIQFPALAQGEQQPHTYRSGDYWLIPARVATGDVEWPKEKDTTGTEVPKALSPHGIEHHYAPLAVISVDAGGAVTRKLDCRRLLP